jgi:cell division protein FtsI (penicillin-binding protein 3)
MDEKVAKEDETVPVVRAGRHEEIAMLCNELGVSNHSATEEEWVRASKEASSITLKKNSIIKDLVPNVTGMTFRDAIYLLEKSGLRVYYEGKGRVAEQSLAPGTRISKGSRIHLKLS